MRLKLTLQELFASTFFIAVAVLSLKLSFDKRIAPGSVPNFYLLVTGFALIAMIPIQFLLVSIGDGSRPVPVITSYCIAFFVSILLVLIALALAILGGVV